MTSGGMTQTEAWNIQLQHRIERAEARVAELEKDLDRRDESLREAAYAVEPIDSNGVWGTKWNGCLITAIKDTVLELDHALTRMAEAYQIFGVLDAELDLFEDALILDVFSDPTDKREVLPFTLPARAQTLLAVIEKAGAWQRCVSRSRHTFTPEEHALITAVQALTRKGTSPEGDGDA